MEEWNSWLVSSNTRMVMKAIKETMEELRELITNGSHIQDKDTGKIALDYTYSLGQLEGMRIAIETIEDIKSIVEERENDR